MRVIRLQDAGYHVHNNDLTLDEWLDLPRVRNALMEGQLNHDR